MKNRIIYLIVVLSLNLTSCFKEDQPLPPYSSEYDVLILENSIYTHQQYVDLSSGNVVATNENTAWDIAFEAGKTGKQIRLNASAYVEAMNTGCTRLDSVFADLSGHAWLRDRPDGNTDSTAIRNWVTISGQDTVYSGDVYILAKYDGIGYSDKLKIQFLHMDSIGFTFAYGKLESLHPDTVKILKDPFVNYVQYSFFDKVQKTLEPASDQWELLFCQYNTILFTDDGVPTPYYVRGVLLNPNSVSAVLDSLHYFEEIDYALAQNLAFSKLQDVIGHDWKSVTIDEASNSAEYTVRPSSNFVIKNSKEEIFKIRFISYLGETGVKGYPSFEYVKLEP